MTLLLYTMIGGYSREGYKIMHANKREQWGGPLDQFVYGGDSVEAVEKSLCLDVREVMTCASYLDPAVTYHLPYGLILEGDIASVFDGDSGLVVQEDGTYPKEPHFDFTKKTTIDNLFDIWYDKFENTTSFIWNEVVLKKGSKILGAFHDPNYEFIQRGPTSSGRDQASYDSFMKQVKHLNLNLIEVKVK